MNKKKIKKTLIDVLCLLPYTYFPGYILVGKLWNIFDLYSLLMYVIITIVYIAKAKFHINKISMLVLIMNIIPIIATIFNKNYDALTNGIKILLGSFSLSLLIEAKMKEKPEIFLKHLITYSGILVIINIFSFYIFYPSMDSKALYFYFLGNDNGTIYETFLYIYISILYYLTCKNKIPKYFFVIVIFIFSGYTFVQSGNGRICLIVTLLLLLTYKTEIFKKIANYKVLIPLYIVIFSMIVIFRNNNIIMQKVLEFLGKGTTFTGRTFIWDAAFLYISKHPIIGNGYENAILTTQKIFQVKAHNLIIQYLYMGGYSMITILFIIIKNVINKIKNNMLSEKINNIMFFSLFMYFVISIFDFYYAKYNFLFIILIYYYSYYLKGVNKNE